MTEVRSKMAHVTMWYEFGIERTQKFYKDPRLGDKNMHENAFDLFSDLMGFGFWTIHIDNRIDNVSNNIWISTRAPADILVKYSAIELSPKWKCS